MDKEYEKLALIVVLSGCGLAIALALTTFICCQLFVKSRYSRCSRSQHLVVFERQTTTSDENNAEYFSCCYEDSTTYDPHDSNSEERTNESHSTVVQTHSEPCNASQPQSQTKQTQPQVKFATRPTKCRKTSLPSKLLNQRTEILKNSQQDDSQPRRSSAGIMRQKSFDEPEELVAGRVKGIPINYLIIASLQHSPSVFPSESKDSLEGSDGKTPENVEKQYKEIWQLRAALEAEEGEKSLPDDSGADTTERSSEQKLQKNDSGYKSIERRDYSIDYKTETIFRQFTSTAPQRESSIQEEEEEEVEENEHQGTYV